MARTNESRGRNIMLLRQQSFLSIFDMSLNMDKYDGDGENMQMDPEGGLSCCCQQQSILSISDLMVVME